MDRSLQVHEHQHGRLWPAPWQPRADHERSAYDLGFASLKYIGGFQQYNYQTGGDNDGTSRTAAITIPGILAGQLYFPTQTTDFNEHKRYFSNEVNLTSNGDGPLRWIVGAYQYKRRIPSAYPAGEPEPGLATRQSADRYGHRTAAAANPLRNYADTQATLTSRAFAVFGQGDLRVQRAVRGDRRAFATPRTRRAATEFQRLIIQSPAIGGRRLRLRRVDRHRSDHRRRAELPRPEEQLGRRHRRAEPGLDPGYRHPGLTPSTAAATSRAASCWAPCPSQPEAKQEQVDAFEIGLKKTFAKPLPAQRGGLLQRLQGSCSSTCRS